MPWNSFVNCKVPYKCEVFHDPTSYISLLTFWGQSIGSGSIRKLNHRTFHGTVQERGRNRTNTQSRKLSHERKTGHLVKKRSRVGSQKTRVPRRKTGWSSFTSQECSWAHTAPWFVWELRSGNAPWELTWQGAFLVELSPCLFSLLPYPCFLHLPNKPLAFESLF